MIYNTLEFITDLKSEIKKFLATEELFRGKLTDENLGLLLGQTKNHIRKKRYQIKNNLDYIIPSNVLKQYSDNLNLKFGNDVQTTLDIIDKYK